MEQTYTDPWQEIQAWAARYQDGSLQREHEIRSVQSVIVMQRPYLDHLIRQQRLHQCSLENTRSQAEINLINAETHRTYNNARVDNINAGVAVGGLILSCIGLGYQIYKNR